jgi:ADP-ribose pyrophosphatase YjhB (NUDIX family)
MEPKLFKNVHLSVGAIIINDKNELLMIDRLKRPFGWACPAGHVDDGETPLEAVKREVKEETGLTVLDIEDTYMTLCDSLEVPQDKCSRGIDMHIWAIFEVLAEGELVFKADEVKAIKWVPIDEIKELELEPVWKFWLEKLNII